MTERNKLGIRYNPQTEDHNKIEIVKNPSSGPSIEDHSKAVLNVELNINNHYFNQNGHLKKYVDGIYQTNNTDNIPFSGMSNLYERVTKKISEKLAISLYRDKLYEDNAHLFTLWKKPSTDHYQN